MGGCCHDYSPEVMKSFIKQLNYLHEERRVDKFLGFTAEEMIGLKKILDERDQTLEEFLEPFQPSKTPALDEAVVMAEQFALDSNMRNPGPIIERVARAAREDIKTDEYETWLRAEETQYVRHIKNDTGIGADWVYGSMNEFPWLLRRVAVY